jgi:hypothetical protein
MAGSLIELARGNQACAIASLIMAGSSGSVTLADITLAQLINPGVPVIYGSTSSAMDMKTGGLAVGAAELSMMVSATAQMARFYKLPSRIEKGYIVGNRGSSVRIDPPLAIFKSEIDGEPAAFQADGEHSIAMIVAGSRPTYVCTFVIRSAHYAIL